LKPPNALAAKGDAVEEWIDLHFFRPVGYRLARALAATRVTADQVTLASLAVGLVAGHLFLYDDWRLGTLGLALFVVSDVLDSADGQVARIRGGGTRFGRVLDGFSDNLRFLNLYLHLLVRLLLGGAGWPAVVLMIAAGLSHSLQASAIDFLRQAYLRFGGAGTGELDLPEDLGAGPAGFWARLAYRGYAGYVQRQVRLFPATTELVRRWRTQPGSSLPTDGYRALTRPVVVAGALIAQNVRFALLAVTAVPGWPAAYFWVAIGPLNLVLLMLIVRQERGVRLLLDTEPSGNAAYAG
jgi:CDP-alcohol phosphatidyltransferase